MSYHTPKLTSDEICEYTLRVVALLSTKGNATLLAIDQAGDPGVYFAEKKLPQILNELETRRLVRCSGENMNKIYNLTELGELECRKPMPPVIKSIAPFHLIGTKDG